MGVEWEREGWSEREDDKDCVLSHKYLTSERQWFCWSRITICFFLSREVSSMTWKRWKISSRKNLMDQGSGSTPTEPASGTDTRTPLCWCDIVFPRTALFRLNHELRPHSANDPFLKTMEPWQLHFGFLTDLNLNRNAFLGFWCRGACKQDTQISPPSTVSSHFAFQLKNTWALSAVYMCPNCSACVGYCSLNAQASIC